MFERWDSFYLLLGGASGSLIGLLFIVATLMRGRERDAALRGASVYMTPIVLDLSQVLVISALAAAPDVGRDVAGGAVTLCGSVGILISLWIIWHIAFDDSFQSAHWTDLWCYGVAALAGDLALTGSGLSFWQVGPEFAVRAVAVSLIGILLVAVRNAWDLVTWISATNQNSQPPTET